MTTALLILAGYVAGSMPFGYWVGRLNGIDIRKAGSGNIGATNVWRVLGPRYGVVVILLDVAKGFAPALAGAELAGDLTGVLAGGAAMLGHWRPLFLGFAKGGKTVATAAGAFFGVAPLVGLLAAVTWVAVFAVGRYASLASMTAAVVLPIVAFALDEPWPVTALGVVAAAAVIVLHRANIRRLRAGTENRFGRRGRASGPATP